MVIFNDLMVMNLMSRTGTDTVYLDNIAMVSFYIRFIWMMLINRATARLCLAGPMFRAEYK